MTDHQRIERARQTPGGAEGSTNVKGHTAKRVMPKLKVGAVADPLEAEADRVADSVMRSLRAQPTIDTVPFGESSKSTSRIRRSTYRPPPIVVSRPTAAPVVRRVPVTWVAGVDADKPSTYDSGGGHSYADHGAQTTKVQHVNRVKTGVAPSGRKSPVPRGKPSSKFASDAKHVEAFKAAVTELTAKNKAKQKIRGDATTIAVASAGTLYYADETEATSGTVRLDIVPVDDTTLRVNSMYPQEDS